MPKHKHKQHPYQIFEASNIGQLELDYLLADGWRHFGENFFRTMQYEEYQNGNLTTLHIIPLRINLAQFSPNKSQRRILAKNSDLRVEFSEPHTIEPNRHILFKKFSQKFTHNRPESLLEFISGVPRKPTIAIECAVWDTNNTLVAASYFDVAFESCSSIIAMMDNSLSKRGLGIFTLLKEIEFAKEHNKKYLYLGYAYTTPSHYDYKKQFVGCEYYDWEGEWRLLTPEFL